MKKIIVVLTILSVLVIIIYFKFKGNKGSDPRGSSYAGSASCVKCHSNLYHSYLHTAHYVASLPATINTVHGSFAKELNVFEISTTKKIIMEKRDSGLFQAYYLNGQFQEGRRFDIVLGGVKGESYLYWRGDGLNQLPISYYTKEHEWLMSPRYAPGLVDFSRIITMRCLECHASYIADRPDKPTELNGDEHFDKTSLVFSIDCERCHGPAAQHVNFQTNNPQINTARFIITYKSLSRARKIDMCAECHSGNKSQMTRSTFFFKPGDTLANFKLTDFYTPNNDPSHLDVHGNQVQLLESSKCFLQSKMDCATCHDTHQNQRGNTALFTQKCLACHSVVNHNYCKMVNEVNAGIIKSNCIKCHMPSFGSKAIVAPNMDKTYNAEILVHTHHIAVYPQEAQKILAMLGK